MLELTRKPLVVVTYDVSQTNAATLPGHRHRQLLVVHFLVLFGSRGIERIVLAQYFVGRAHGFEHFVEEQRLKLLRHLAHIAVAFAIAHFQAVEPVQVGEGPRIAASDAALAQVHNVSLKSRSGRLATHRPV